ncbi:hypothetical protein UY3_02984 [Chelonia mydas]|uniref:Uncharacterized protein n=1 Tax=Chelonia mydas TaxID=8469 RepID=M7CFX3_CHEMY|nr:hypothetical protein UY3_02984 [Chelonia mydas]
MDLLSRDYNSHESPAYGTSLPPGWGVSTLTVDRRCGDRSIRGRFNGSSEDPLNRLQIGLPSTLVLHWNEKHKLNPWEGLTLPLTSGSQPAAQSAHSCGPCDILRAVQGLNLRRSSHWHHWELGLDEDCRIGHQELGDTVAMLWPLRLHLHV